MDKELQTYYKEMNELVAGAKGTDRDELRGYHAQRVAEFQHERLVHLLVTFFFAGLMLGSWAGLALSLATFDGVFIGLVGLLVLILTVLEVFYIQYYYRLENGVQRLYEITKLLKD